MVGSECDGTLFSPPCTPAALEGDHHGSRNSGSGRGYYEMWPSPPGHEPLSARAGHSAMPNEEEAPQWRLFPLNRASHDCKASHCLCRRRRDRLGIQLSVPLFRRRLSPHLQPLVRGSHRCPHRFHGHCASSSRGVNYGRSSACLPAMAPDAACSRTAFRGATVR